jgi:hypothetical protein
MNTAEMFVRAMNVFSDRKVSEEKPRRMIQAIEIIIAEPDKPEPVNYRGCDVDLPKLVPALSSDFRVFG